MACLVLRSKTRVELVAAVELDADFWDALIAKRLVNENQREKIAFLLRSKTRVELVAAVELDADFWDALIAKRLVNENQREKIALNATRKEQVGRLLDHLTRRDDNAFDGFCDALIESDQEHVVTKYLKVFSKKRDRSAVDSTSLEPHSKKHYTGASEPSNHGNTNCTAAAASDDDGYNDDEDLVDGPQTVFVEKCQPSFYKENHKQAYSMSRRSRGHALIINVRSVAGHPPRTGTDIDRDKLQDLLKQLHFDNVVTYNDEDGLSAEDILDKVECFVKIVPMSVEACVVCILSHGEDGHIFGTDGNVVRVSAIETCLNEENAPALAGKPKMLILQACRGKMKDDGVCYDEPDSLHPSSSDLVICYPTVKGYMAWRNQTRGSWFIAAIVQVFQKHSCRLSVNQLLTQVNNMVSNCISRSSFPDMDGKKQTPEFCSRLRKEWYFFPGYYEK